MKVYVFEGGKLLGSASLTALDPCMGVAMGSFEPSTEYDAALHANVLDGDYIADHSRKFLIKTDDGKLILSNAVSIQDFPTLNEIELHILGIFEPSFESLFDKNSEPLS